MRKRSFFWSKLTSTFWFLPVLIILLGIGLAFGFVSLDSHLKYSYDQTGLFVIRSANSARGVLTTIAGAMINVAGTVFSITLVVLTLASTQFGPRLIKKFMLDRINQVVLGSYVSTFIYSLIILNTIKGDENSLFLPYFSIMFSITAALVNIVLLIIFIHNIAVNIQADKVISDINQKMYENIRVLFPKETEDEITQNNSPDEDPDEDSVRSGYPVKQSVLSPANGYLQYIDNDLLYDTAIKLDGMLEFHFRPGDFVVEDMEIVTSYTSEQTDNKEIRNIQSGLIIGKTRTHLQDAEFSIHQMVEMAARALSPGVNDPFTAITCIDNLTSVMCYLARVKFPSRYRYSEDGKLRIIAEITDYEGMIDSAFNQIRQFSAELPSVMIKLMEALITIDKFTETPSHKKVIKKHAQLVLNMATISFKEPSDLEDLKARSKLVVDE